MNQMVGAWVYQVCIQCFANPAGRTHAQSPPGGGGEATGCRGKPTRAAGEVKQAFSTMTAPKRMRGSKIARSPRWPWRVVP